MNMNKMNKKGFTLIELLAVIVILAIIILIAVFAILPQVEKSKKNAVKDSTHSYIKNCNNMSDSITDDVVFDGTYTVENDKITIDGTTYHVNISGTMPISGEITFDHNKVTSGCLNYKKYYATITNESKVTVDEGTCE